jgi:hypothetical protein
MEKQITGLFISLLHLKFTVRASTPRHHRALAYLPTHDFLPTNGALAKTLDALLWPRSPFPTASWRPKTAPFPLPACACCPNRRRDRRTCSLPATSRCPQPFSVPLSRLQARVVSLAPDAHLVMCWISAAPFPAHGVVGADHGACLHQRGNSPP